MSIRIKSLKVDPLYEKNIERKYLYKDLGLDLKQEVFFNKQLNKNESLKDLAPIYDIEAIKNSIKNAFLTSPGDKILNPEYGADLRQFIFEPVSLLTEFAIRETILDRLPIMEPRIELVNVVVVGNEDDKSYNITIQINVPSLNIKGLSIISELNSTGYVIT